MISNNFLFTLSKKVCVGVCRAVPSYAGISLIAFSKTTAPDNAVCKIPPHTVQNRKCVADIKEFMVFSVEVQRHAFGGWAN